MPKHIITFILDWVWLINPYVQRDAENFNFLFWTAWLYMPMAKDATFVDTIEGNLGLPEREALPYKGFTGCATKVDKSKKCRTPFLIFIMERQRIKRDETNIEQELGATVELTVTDSIRKPSCIWGNREVKALAGGVEIN